MTVVLVVDLARVLDESALGKRGAVALQARFDDARAQHDKLQSRATTVEGQRKAEEAAAAFAADALTGIEGERARLRAELLSQVRPIVASLMQSKNADVVIDAGACLAIGAGVDITDDVLQRLPR